MIRRNPIAAIVLILTALILSSCGQMGPLYLPSEEPPAANTSTPAVTAPSEASEAPANTPAPKDA